MAEITYEQLQELLERPIAYHPVFIVIAGSPAAGLFLSQLWYWSKKTKDTEGWIHKKQSELEEETALTRDHQETARKLLIERNLIEEKRAGEKGRLNFRVNREVIVAALKNPQKFAADHNTKKKSVSKARKIKLEKLPAVRYQTVVVQQSDQNGAVQQSTMLQYNSQERCSTTNTNVVVPQSGNSQVVDCVPARARVPDPEKTTTETTTEIHVELALDGTLPEEKPPKKEKARDWIPPAKWRVVVLRIWEQWKLEMKSPRSRLTKERGLKIIARLESIFTEEDAIQGIRGCANSPFHMGKNEEKTKHNDIELIFRDDTHLEKFIAKAPAPTEPEPEIDPYLAKHAQWEAQGKQPRSQERKAV